MRELVSIVAPRSRRRGLLLTGYLRELAGLAVLMVAAALLSSGRQLPGEVQATRKAGLSLPVYGLGFVDGKLWVNRLQAGASDYDIDTGEMINDWPLDARALCDVARGGGAQGTTAVLCSTGRLMIVRDQQIHVRFSIAAGETNLNDVDVSRDGKTVVAVHPSGRVHLWSWNGRTFEQRIFTIDMVADLVRFHPEDHVVAIASGSGGQISVWNLDHFERRSQFEPTGSRVTQLAWAPRGDILVSGSEDGQVRVWQVDREQLLWEARADVVAPSALAVSIDGKTLAAGGFDKVVRLYSLADGTPQGGLVAHSGAIRALSFDPSGQKLVSGGLDGDVFVWSLTPRKLLRKIAFDQEG